MLRENTRTSWSARVSIFVCVKQAIHYAMRGGIVCFMHTNANVLANRLGRFYYAKVVSACGMKHWIKN